MRRFPTTRRGLAMLELAMAMPVLLLIMALMINYGTVACWKVRGLMMANYTIAGVRYPRSASTLPRPGYWPSVGGTYGTADWTATSVDILQVNQPIARGPLLDPISDPTRSLPVRTTLLDPTLGFGEGHADLSRRFAMVARLGTYTLHAQDHLLENLWPFSRTGLGSNVDRRLPVLYTLLQASAGYSSAFSTAVWAILNAPWCQELLPLERDLPNFPSLPINYCSTDRAQVEEWIAFFLLDRNYGYSIPRIPDRMEELLQETTQGGP
jgi:hypothetical protein